MPVIAIPARPKMSWVFEGIYGGPGPGCSGTGFLCAPLEPLVRIAVGRAVLGCTCLGDASGCTRESRDAGPRYLRFCGGNRLPAAMNLWF